jgi:hypothetical protein
MDKDMSMTPPIGRFLNRTILVSIPALFEDGVSRPYKLLGIELHGLWLQSDDLTRRLLSDETDEYAATEPAVFVPFAQIAGVIVPTTLAGSLPPGAEESSAVERESAAETPVSRRTRRRTTTGESTPAASKRPRRASKRSSGGPIDERKPEALASQPNNAIVMAHEPPSGLTKEQQGSCLV